jgi:hypothetical protein
LSRIKADCAAPPRGHLDRGAGLRFLAHLMHFASSRAGAVDLGGLLAFATALSALFA